jgi:hypothetical protein
MMLKVIQQKAVILFHSDSTADYRCFGQSSVTAHYPVLSG